MTLSKLAFWNKTDKAPKVNNGSGKVKKFLSQLSGAFMLPISVMAVAGLFLGIGAAINSHTSSEAAQTIGAFIKNIGDPVFGMMPVLFMVAVVISFTDDIGTAVFAGLVGFFVFNAIQTPFIKNDLHVYQDASGSWHYANVAKDAADHVITDTSGNLTYTNVPAGAHVFDGARFLFIDAGADIAHSLFKAQGSVAGLTALNTSIFAGVIAGIIISILYKKFYTIQLPAMISFFGGKRFVSFVAIAAMIPLAFVFLLVWPWIALGFAKFGEYSGKVAGLDSFLFGFVERALIPFGLHHVFYAPLWWTGAGGDVIQTLHDLNGAGTDLQITAINSTTYADGHAGFLALVDKISSANSGNNLGDSFGWLAVNGSGVNTITGSIKGATFTDAKIFEFFSDHGLNLGRFMQGKFAFMQFGLPAAAAAMVMAAPKENRKLALGTVFPAALTSFTTGVTEPIEFTFLFLAPALFFGFHALMAAFSFLIMNLVGAHVGMTFSGGFIDLMIYGALPISQGTNFWWALVIGAGYAPIYFFVFYFSIKKWDLQTPGRGTNTKLFTKADFKAKQEGEASATSEKGALRSQSKDVVIAMGGWDNITKFTNCATRLRYDVVDKSKVNEAGLKAAGAVGVVWQGNNHLQAIFGPQAEQINTNIKSNVGADLGLANAAPNAAEKTTVKEAIIKAEHKVVDTIKKDTKIVAKKVVEVEHKIADKLHKKPAAKKPAAKK